MKMMIVLGTRPEAIKLAPVIMEARNRPDMDLDVVFTGQHADLVPPIMNYFGVSFDCDLGVMRIGQDLNMLTGHLFQMISSRVITSRPDVILAQGDTTSVMVAAMVAFHSRVPFCHVEAGLRTESIESPFPEEMNRRICTMAASIHCCPTSEAAENVKAVKDENVHVTGNTIVDALKMMPVASPPLVGRLVTITCHRRENRGEPFRNVAHAVQRLASEHPDIKFAWLTHPSNTDQLQAMPSNVHVLPPTTYAATVAMIRHSELVLTDSGGILEEAVTVGTPVQVIRENTEREEALQECAAVLSGVLNSDRIFEVANSVLTGERVLAVRPDLYGDGEASTRIVDICQEYMKTGPS